MRLHPDKGVNPRMGYCPRCGKSNNELLLIGAHTSKYRCLNCDLIEYGGKPSGPCPKCQGTYRQYEGQIEEGEQIPTSLCDPCEKEVAEHRAIVADGGIHWKCKECEQSGVIKKTSPICQAVRKHAKIEPPDPVGIEFEKCEEHGVSETPDS